MASNKIVLKTAKQIETEDLESAKPFVYVPPHVDDDPQEAIRCVGNCDRCGGWQCL